MAEAGATRLISEIKIGPRYRKDLGNLEALASSFRSVGLLHPPVITPDNTLIAGARRCAAWAISEYRDQPIPVRVLPLDQIARGEYAENAHRKDFTPSEIVSIEEALRAYVATPVGRPRKEISASCTNKPKGKTTEKVAAFAGVSARQIEKAKAVVTAAKAEPEKFGKLVEVMDRTGRVNGPYKRLQNIRASAAIRDEPLPLPMNGPYRTGLIDVPWASEPGDADKDHGARGYYPYPTMTPEQVAALPVPSILHADASVWMWIPNFHLMHGHHLSIAHAWKLKPVALLTWVKRRWGQGQRSRAHGGAYEYPDHRHGRAHAGSRGCT